MQRGRQGREKESGAKRNNTLHLQFQRIRCIRVRSAAAPQRREIK